MAKKKHSAEQIVVTLRRTEVELANHREPAKPADRPRLSSKPSYFPSQNGEVKVGPVHRQVRGVERKR
jgi:hypothetical protein